MDPKPTTMRSYSNSFAATKSLSHYYAIDLQDRAVLLRDPAVTSLNFLDSDAIFNWSLIGLS